MRYVVITGRDEHIAVHGPFDRLQVAMEWAAECFGGHPIYPDIDWEVKPLNPVDWET